MLQCLNDPAILNTNRDPVEALDLTKAINEIFSRTQTCRNKFGMSS